MLDRFNELSLRERVLVGIMIALIMLFILLQLIILPLMRMHNQSSDAQLRAQKDRIYVEQNISRLGGLSATQSQETFSRMSLINASRATGIEQVSRIQPQPNGDLKLWLDDVPANTLFVFLSRVEQQYATRVTGAQITRRDGDLVSAQVSFTLPDDNQSR